MGSNNKQRGRRCGPGRPREKVRDQTQERRVPTMKRLLISLIGVLVPLPILAAQNAPTAVPAGTPVTITVKPATPEPPPVSIVLKGRHGHVTPHSQGCCHTGSGYIDIQQPTPDVVVITMTGVAVAVGSPTSAGVASVDFDLDQCFEVSFDKQ